ncbi:unnamed protein product [Rodentolepis nana]|uniref:choline-phosphate cytidylyltransferase n=1 Tax=Rodentolepis nana TaxID=102285 RepID=A0A158QGR7_RODNA|nr:unnamed protein product [Rodentolepis nana]
MLKLRALARYLERVKSDGVQSIMIFSTEGVPLTQCGADLSSCKTTAAIVSNVWSLYQRQLAMNESASLIDTMQDVIVEMTNARLVFTKVANFIICLTTTKDMNLGLMRAKTAIMPNSSKTSGRSSRSSSHSTTAEPQNSVTEEISCPKSWGRGPAPFSNEPAALRALEECDYSIKITLDMAKTGQVPRRVRIYADGVYDMFHSGHARQLMQACSVFPDTYLIVGVSSDQDTKFHKGQTVMNEQERYEAVRHCRYVDEVVKACPWECTIDFLKSMKVLLSLLLTLTTGEFYGGSLRNPFYLQIDFIAHDDIPYATDGSKDLYQPFKDADMQVAYPIVLLQFVVFLTTQRTEGISTTDVIGRILKDYDGYLRRNISRGLTRHDLNISYVKEKQLLLENNLHTIAEKGSRFLDDIGSRRRRIVASLEDLYQDCSASFVNFFGNRGALRHWLSGTTRTLRGVVEPTENKSRSSISLPPSPISILDKVDSESEDANDSSSEGGYCHRTSRSAVRRITGGAQKRSRHNYDNSEGDSDSGKRSRH